ncbi:hypothetical protein RLT57_07005 [Streptomyces sp. ITFR-21]|nr:hypothetical protein [Streptomyces sp. ITFR-21]WNI15306.1 hypothetical protein RLT57_07005 [Streptomyces sp. ITFR-21]
MLPYRVDRAQRHFVVGAEDGIQVAAAAAQAAQVAVDDVPGAFPAEAAPRAELDPRQRRRLAHRDHERLVAGDLFVGAHRQDGRPLLAVGEQVPGRPPRRPLADVLGAAADEHRVGGVVGAVGEGADVDEDDRQPDRPAELRQFLAYGGGP